MMNKILLLALFVTPALWAQDESEEAIILNQELQFLEDSAKTVSVGARVDTTPQVKPRMRAVKVDSLEKQYFGEESDDRISTGAAAPKRRSK